ncbi:MAG: hypothetical protein KBD14_02755 [Candidatus Pacebacteria bacterium]|nr:hypothetical protein [Candidatus Paceibacterota bacterium]
MHKNEKLLRKLSKEDRNRIIFAVNLIQENNFQILDFKKLANFKNIYRVRVGDFRIIFKVNSNYNEILEILRRSETTYK